MKRNWIQGALVTTLLAGTASLYAESSKAGDEQDAVMASAETSVAQTTLNIEVINVQSDVGSLYISVYDSKESFLGTEWFEHKVLRVADHLEGERIAFDLQLPAGEYAIAIHHDDNDNKKMDTNFIGIPKEPVAMSNNHIPRFGPPKYKKAKFQLASEPQSMQFKL